MKIVGFGLQEGAGFWRTRIPFGELNRHGHKCYLSPNEINDAELEKADVVTLKNVTDKMGIATLQYHRELHGLRIAIDIDDDITLADTNPMKKKHEVEDARFVFIQTCKIADVVTTTTEYLATKLRKYNKNVAVIPNCYEKTWFTVKSRPSDELRIGWTGSVTHQADLEMVAPAIKRIKEKYPQVKFVTRGDPRIKEWWGQDVEVFPTVPIAYHPEGLAAMGIDIGICPLIDDEFNRCKSQIKAMEFGLLGIPVVCSPTVYGNYLGLTIAHTEDDWVNRLSELIESPKLRIDRGGAARGWAEENFNIENNYKLWEDAYTYKRKKK